MPYLCVLSWTHPRLWPHYSNMEVFSREKNVQLCFFMRVKEKCSQARFFTHSRTINELLQSYSLSQLLCSTFSQNQNLCSFNYILYLKTNSSVTLTTNTENLMMVSEMWDYTGCGSCKSQRTIWNKDSQSYQEFFKDLDVGSKAQMKT